INGIEYSIDKTRDKSGLARLNARPWFRNWHGGRAHHCGYFGDMGSKAQPDARTFLGSEPKN
ncbi:MAG TPA: hypothetical protein VFK94_01590, partial [Patescibacteria group bacterium]|nr:hypothetical protein [Patescibacteria group bacterium]